MNYVIPLFRIYPHAADASPSENEKTVYNGKNKKGSSKLIVASLIFNN
jgi:hypothetical protein